MTAIRDGKPIDTTMGYTPNEGLLMRTRSGDIDPGLLTWLQRHEDWSPEDTNRVLNQESGWFGLSRGISNMADLFISEQPESRLAFDLFDYRFKKALGAYFAILGGLNGIVLSGGIAENNTVICQQLLSGLLHLGVELAEVPKQFEASLCLTKPTSPVQCWVVAADEAAAMLRSAQKHYSFHDGSQPMVG